MRTREKRFANILTVRFGLGCLLAIVFLAVSVLVYDNFKAGVFFAVIFVFAGIVKISENTISQKYLPGVYTIWLIVACCQNGESM